MTYGTEILGSGSAFPRKSMANAEFEAFIDTSDEWIRTRTGIETRRIAGPGETTVSISEEAARHAIEMAGISPDEIDLVIVGTVTPDTVMPSTANTLQARLGIKRAFSFDLQAACSGFAYALSIADHFIRAGTVKTALVVGAETLSSVVDWSDRTTCVLFGDGAGAAIVRRTEGEHRIIGSKLYSDGNYGDILMIPHGYARVPPTSAEFRYDMRCIKMKGTEVFKLAVRNMIDCSNELLESQSLTPKDINFFIFHQANMRIIELCMKAFEVDPSRTWLNVQKYGNTSAATLPVCFDEAWRAGAIKKGDLVLMATFGGGVTWASTLIRL